MEEILASIRKIIESNEPGAGKSISTSLPPVYAASNDDEGGIHLTVDDEYETMSLDDVPPVSTLIDPRFVAANSPGAAREADPAERTMSLADVAARVRAASERTATQAGAPREAAPMRELPPAMAARFAEIRREPIAPPARSMVPEDLTALPFAPAPSMPRIVEAPIPVAVDLEQPMEDEFSLAASDEVPVDDIEPEFPAGEIAPAPQSAYREEPAAPEFRLEAPKLLISEAAGQQVARSFEDLAAAIDGVQRRSLDEIAQEMLRPMLQEWLDDNLPTLVERLVREEIERVARGPRR
jgi:cell pole-organizing protein PopZ